MIIISKIDGLLNLTTGFGDLFKAFGKLSSPLNGYHLKMVALFFDNLAINNLVGHSIYPHEEIVVGIMKVSSSCVFFHYREIVSVEVSDSTFLSIHQLLLLSRRQFAAKRIIVAVLDIIDSLT